MRLQRRGSEKRIASFREKTRSASDPERETNLKTDG